MHLAGTEHRVTTENNGTFRMAAVDAGDYVLHVSTVGYHLLMRRCLIELQRHAQELAANPAKWMPWNYRETVALVGI